MATDDAPRLQLTPLEPLVRAVESAQALDGPAKAAGKQIRAVLGGGPLKDALSGTWLGHALHPVLTDVVIGSFTGASLLDLLAPRSDGQAGERRGRDDDLEVVAAARAVVDAELVRIGERRLEELLEPRRGHLEMLAGRRLPAWRSWGCSRSCGGNHPAPNGRRLGCRTRCRAARRRSGRRT